METQYIWVASAIILLLVEFWAINSVLKSGGHATSRLMWLAIIIFVPLFGMLAWLIVGPRVHNSTALHHKAHRSRSH